MAKPRNKKSKTRSVSGGGSLTSMRKGFRGVVRGGGGARKKESTFWNVLFYILMAFAAILILSRLT